MRTPTFETWEVWNFTESEADIAIGPVAGGVAVAQVVTANAHGIVTPETIAIANKNARKLAAAPELLASLDRLSSAALGREITMGDPCRLLEAKAELAAATEEAIALLAKVERGAK